MASATAVERLTWVGYLLIGFLATAFGSSLPVLRHELGVGYPQLSLLFVATAIGNTAAYFVANPLVDRVGSQRVFLWGLLLFAACTVPLVLSHRLLLWLGASAVLGVGFAFVDVGASRIVNELHRPRPAQALNRLNLFFGVGAIGAPMIVALGVRLDLGSRPAFAVVVLLASGAAALLWARHGAGVRPQAPQTAPDPVRETLTLLREAPWMRLLAVAMFFYICAEAGFGSWISAYVHARAGVGAALAALYPSAYQAGLTTVRVAMGPWLQQLRLERLLTLGGLVAIGGGILVGAGGQLPLLDLLGTVVAGIGFALVFPVALSIASERAPGREGITYGVLYQALALAALLAPWLEGQVFVHSPLLAILVTPLCAVAMTVAAAPLARRTS